MCDWAFSKGKQNDSRFEDKGANSPNRSNRRVHPRLFGLISADLAGALNNCQAFRVKTSIALVKDEFVFLAALNSGETAQAALLHR